MLGFVNDLDIIGKNMEIVKEKFVPMETKGIDFGLKVDDTKMEYMNITPLNRPRNRQSTHTNTLIAELWYLGSQLNIDNSIMDEIRRRITSGNRSYFSILNILKTRLASKCTLYRSVMRPVVT